MTSNTLILGLWWMLIVALSGVLGTRALTVMQKILVVFYSTQVNVSKDSAVGGGKWQITIVQAITWVLKVMLWIVIVTMVASRIGIPASLITALGTVLGAALGFGSQETVRDVVKGTVHLMERQFSVGDVVGFTIGGIDYVGVVDDVTLRTVMVSTETDGVVSVPQGNIAVIKNYSRGEGEFLVTLPFDTGDNIAPTLGYINDIVDSIDSKNIEVISHYASEEDIDSLMHIKQVSSRGIGDVQAGGIVVQIKGEATPGEQFGAKRALLKVVSNYLNAKGVHYQKLPLATGGEE